MNDTAISILLRNVPIATPMLRQADKPQFLLATYFGSLDENLALATSLPMDGLHIDLVGAPAQLNAVLAPLPKEFVLSLGLVDGRNI